MTCVIFFQLGVACCDGTSGMALVWLLLVKQKGVRLLIGVCSCTAATQP